MSRFSPPPRLACLLVFLAAAQLHPRYFHAGSERCRHFAGVGLPYSSAEETCVDQTGCLLHSSCGATTATCEWQDGDGDGVEETTDGISATIASEEECLAEVQALDIPGVTGATYHASSMMCAAEIAATAINPQPGYRSCLFVQPTEVETAERPCLQASSGYYLTNTTVYACAAGTYIDAAGSDEQSDCIGCAAGKYSTTAGSSSAADCIDCIAGKYSTVAGSSSESNCTECLAGKYVETSGN
eukprot:COSAG06_NODE_4613_length_4100_cov_14.926268_1_plen_242_part_10